MRKFQHYDFAFQLHIQLLDTKPAIWRRVLVPVDYTFGQLHQVIQQLFAWHNTHLHTFQLAVLVDNGMDILTFEPILQDFGPIVDDALDENLCLLKDYLKIGHHMQYHYDFGDDWIHEILVEGQIIQLKKQKYPACIDGGNHHAFEDIGGVYGYQNTVDILMNPNHDQHKDLKAWLKDVYGAAKINKFDPTFFDAKKIKFSSFSS